jgi:glutamate dehydrogenase
MAFKFDSRKTETIEEIRRIVAGKLKGRAAAQADAFVRGFYATMPPADIAAYSAENLYGLAVSFWKYSRQRVAGEPLVRAFNPSPEEHGWKSNHTIIEIVNDDMPFLVDSVTAELNYLGLTVHLVIHPIFDVVRDADGALGALVLDTQDGALRESFMHIEIDEQTDPARLERLVAAIRGVLADVRAAVADWPLMQATVRDILASLAESSPDVPPDEIEETRTFLDWLLDNNFTLLGYREYVHQGKGSRQTLKVSGEGLGVLRDAGRQIFERWADNEPLPEEIRLFMQQPSLLMLTKANQRATVHRRVHMDVIGIKKFDAQGKVVGERMIVGLFTSTAYSRSPSNIPVLRRKIARMVARAGLPASSHDAKALVHILENYPRDELWQIDDDTLFEHVMGILHLQERQRTTLFVRQDPFKRYVTALVFVPRDRYNTDLRERISAILDAAFAGQTVAFYPEFSQESVLARVLFVIKLGPQGVPDYSVDEIEAELREAARSWPDKLHDALIETHGEEKGVGLFACYGDGFSLGYRDRYSPETAVLDIDRIDTAGTLGMNLYRPIEEEANIVRLKLYRQGRPLPLSDILPMLENMGLKVNGEEPFEVTVRDDETTRSVWIHDFDMQTRSGEAVDLGATREKFQEALGRVFSGAASDDGFNVLVLAAGLTWQQVLVLRTYCKFLLQARIAFSQAYMEETLAKNAGLARCIVELFECRFDPARHAAANMGETEKRRLRLRGEIDAALENVANLDEDRIIRRFVNAVEVSLRTNYYQYAADGSPKPYLSIKLDSRSVDELPEPRPLYEITVYSPRMEGCHLRGGEVARGGIRWSDRREDFRTEILGLQKAQMVKNAVIVPVGSKGGFVCKQLPAPTGDAAVDRKATLDEVIACYTTLMNGMLDLTDNLVGGVVVPPADVVRHDGDDPYLVVAADKGTATFSDIANGISVDYGFWLDDAFASGGSAGYDHKKMAITARGAWESVKRHFREIGHDAQSQDFSVVGVGDMSGDVFGNGMLLSEHIRLLGAFNHLHIFIDPDPDPAKGLVERRRLFDLPRSSWADYDAALISQGGGIFDRKAKSIQVTPEMKALFGLAKAQVTPNELIRAMLTAQIDLLWFGGIGSYVKSSRQSHADADDRSNDAVRVNATELRCKVIGEGANLGVTQLGRIEFAQRGGHLNTDFIDNSAGVDCSDHEVNIKIVLGDVVADGELTRKQRDKLLESMTDEVAGLVLADNYLQTQAISQAMIDAPSALDSQWQMMRQLERAGELNRAIEFLPDDEELERRIAAGEGLTRPEYAVLFSYAKMTLYRDTLPTDVPDDPYLTLDLARYFPKELRKRFPTQIARHRLRREIIATYLTNSLINRMGAAFITEIEDRTAAEPSDIARAYVAARDAFALRPIWRAIEGLDNKVAAGVQARMAIDVARLAERATLWFLTNLPRPLSIARTIEEFAADIAVLVKQIPTIVAVDDAAAMERRKTDLTRQGVPDELAGRIAGLDVLAAALDIVRLAHSSSVSVVDTGRIYFAIGARLGIDRLRLAAQTVKSETEWQRMAVETVVDDSYSHQAALTVRVLDAATGGKLGRKAVDGLIETWLAAHTAAIRRVNNLMEEIHAEPELDQAMLTVANGQLRALVAA